MIQRVVACVAVLVAAAGQVQAGPIGYTNDNSFLYGIDLATGVSTQIGSLGVGGGDYEAMAFDPTDGTLYMYNDVGGLFTVNTITGAATFVGGSTGVFNGGMSFNSVGQGYVGDGDGDFFSLNKVTGALTAIGTSAPGMSGIEFAGNNLYAVGDNGSTPDLLLVDITNGNKTSVGPLGVSVSAQAGLGYDGNTLYLLDEDSSSIYSVNTNTGQATLIAALSGDVGEFESLAVLSIAPPVPEPSSLALFSIGACGVVAACRRRRQKHQDAKA
jgi:hypothetical protein